jgi:2-polyprenyl-6-hydroxyphenyl methylase/3-demethylubiquinone-9 3-methyltransferase
VEYYERLWRQIGEVGEVQPERFELRRDFALERLEPGERVLDVGCGEGWFCDAFAAAGFVAVGVDVAPEAIRRARARYPSLEFALCGETSMPFADGSFGAAWLGEVLEHVRDGIGLLAEVARVVGPGGLLLASTPDHGVWRRLALGLSRRAFERHFEPRADHLRFFTRRTLAALLDAGGFDHVELRTERGVLLVSARAAR